MMVIQVNLLSSTLCHTLKHAYPPSGEKVYSLSRVLKSACLDHIHRAHSSSHRHAIHNRNVPSSEQLLHLKPHPPRDVSEPLQCPLLRA